VTAGFRIDDRKLPNQRQDIAELMTGSYRLNDRKANNEQGSLKRWAPTCLRKLWPLRSSRSVSIVREWDSHENRMLTSRQTEVDKQLSWISCFTDLESFILGWRSWWACLFCYCCSHWMSFSYMLTF